MVLISFPGILFAERQTVIKALKMEKTAKDLMSIFCPRFAE